MNRPKISVVVPIYNVSAFLRQCLDSIIHQTLDDLEVILVNDQSPDPKDDEICLEYTSKYDRVTYVKHEENKGLGGARNTGLFAAKADYVAFIDSDDWLEPTFFEELYHAAERKDADIAQCYFYKKRANGTKVQRLKAHRKQADTMNAINSLAWNKIYKKSLFLDHNILYPEKIASQDVATMSRLIYFVDSVALVRKPLYNYREDRAGSLTSRYPKLLTDLPVVFDIIKSFLVDENKFESDQLFFEKRVMRSLNHHLERMLKEPSMTEHEKNELVKDKLENSLQYLRLPGGKKYHTLTQALKSLKRYRRTVEVKILLKEISYLFSFR
ncbi:glycosyltransferase family 2 protein [Marinoscillum furvescens]|uniref:Glycosyl transferase family 2 n=1 Tax=Marinoscillum furvescens DSM 4134 TaxID=1122208 RepID=A0A3D9L259_MARFU|nr:glycosyltransferase [Marinoscillum furvescens]RED98002.1 glycosyl transferase family 2 [Marinoscillum furvescens DSM 4134]